MRVDKQIKGTGQLKISGTVVNVSLNVPKASVKAKKILGVFHQLANIVVDVGEEQAKSQGQTVSCRAGCGACCRQLVPIAVAEAYQLRDLAEAMPKAKREKMRQKFSAAMAKTQETDLHAKLLVAAALSPQARKELAIDYFSKGIACPFLEDESCSIHPLRPVVCREYLVSSDPAFCATPETKQVDGLAMPTKVSKALYALSRTETVHWMPLIWALDWAENHPDDTPSRTGPEWVAETFKKL